MKRESVWFNKKNGWVSLMILLIGMAGKLGNSLGSLVSPAKNERKTHYYSPPYNPTIPYLSVDLRDLIVKHAEDYYNEKWEISLSQYMAWIASISLGEASNLRWAAHSGSAVGTETFYHITIGKKFPFSTSIGAFQLGYGGGKAESWGTMPTIDKLNPEKSLLSVLRWHKNRIGPGATLADFQKKSAWHAVKRKTFEENWQLITQKSWDECKDIKIEVVFHPPVTDASPYQQIIKHIGRVYWGVAGWQNHFDTWLISAKTYLNGEGLYSYSYYYAKNEETGWEIWVWNGDNLNHGYKRNYTHTHLPNEIEGKYAGFSSKEPILEPNRISLN